MDNKVTVSHYKRILLYSVSSLLMVLAYLVIDGMGMFINTYNFIGGKSTEDLSNTNYSTLLQNDDASLIMADMMNLYRARVVLLIAVLFPIVFISLTSIISFKRKGSDSKGIIPYLRVFLGLIAFYYIISWGTIFSHEMFTNFYSFGNWPSFFRIVGAFAALGAFIIDWPLFVRSIELFSEKHPWLCKGVFVLFVSVCSCMLTEFQIGSKMNMVTYMLYYNIFYWVILQVFVDLITGNVKIGAFISLGLSYLIGLINDVVYQFRGNYIMFGDLTVVRTALEVAGNYKYRPGFWFWISLVLLVLTIAGTVFIKIPKSKKPGLKEIIIRTVLDIILVVCVIVTFSNGMLYRNVFGVGWDYNTNVVFTGYIPYFLSNMNSIQTVTLDGYNAELVSEVLVGNEDDVAHTYPNIIIIQNEAFSDLSVAYDIETNQDYMPFIHSLTENTRKGYLNMSITGGPTANTEFEILMRSTLSFLPYGSVPYTQYVDTDFPSAVQVLRHQSVPYYTVAYHPYYSSGYRRYEVYNHFGFDEIVFEDDYRSDFPESDIPRDYLSDSADYRRVEQMFESFRSTSDAPWFCFNVTIQNHGGYTQVFEPAEENRVYVTNFEATDSINSYLSLIKTSDEAFSELVEYFEACDEPTIIAMYGDHQPSFDDEAISILETHPRGENMNSLNEYYVPYIIWANFDIEEEDTLGSSVDNSILNTISTNYFASVVFDCAGIELSAYDRYLLNIRQNVPAITAIGVWDSEGDYYNTIETSPYSADLANLQMVQYNLIFDDDGRLTDRYE